MSWFEAYRAYDDDTLTALANVGLLRRALKDVEAGKVGWGEGGLGDAAGVVIADGQAVQLDARGPQQARCGCPAPGLCKHILGAALWLRALDNKPALTSTEAEAPADPLAEILALDPAVLFKAAGLAALRRAAATPLSGFEWRLQGGALVMELPELGQACRWVAGAGFAGMISDVPANERKAVHLIAIAALRRMHGRPLDWPEAVRPAAPAEDEGRLGESERAFLAQVEAMLRELLQGGLSHVSELTSARLLALNMSARGEGLPRVAALLRNLGGVVDLLVRRDHRADERDGLAVMARLHALCVALADAQGELARALRGRLRRDFDETAALTLLPLGAHWWQTRGGARGLSLAFWDVDGARLLQATLARPDGSDFAFHRSAAWTALAFWPGVGSAQRICEGTLRLDQPRLADDGRLALAGVTRASAMPLWAADDPRLASVGCGDWGELAARLRAATGLAGEPFDSVLLRPAVVGTPVLDETRQELGWPLQDAAGHWLGLAIPVADEHRQKLDNLDRLIARGTGVQAVLVRIERAGAGTTLIPVALLVADAQGRLVPISLDFAQEPARTTSLANRILRLFEARRQQAAPAAFLSSLADRLLAPVTEVLETQAATGRMALTEVQRQRLEEAGQRLRSVGLTTLDAALSGHLQRPDAASLLRLYQLGQWAGELDGLPFAPA